MDDQVIPRCSHRKIILACPHDDCQEQSIYLMEMHLKIDAWYDEQQRRAEQLVHDYFH